MGWGGNSVINTPSELQLLAMTPNITFLRVISVLLCFKYASSIFCYDCNSAYDPRCGENFDSFSLGVVNCSLRDPPEHIVEHVEPTFCRVIKMEIYGNIRVVRQCGYLQEDNGVHMCRRQTGNGEVFVTYCTCDTDLCNAATNSELKMALFAILTLHIIKNILL